MLEKACPIETAVRRMHKTGEEFCVCCGSGLGFLASLHIENPKRFEKGAYYVEGTGQVGACCGRNETDPGVVGSSH